MGTGIQGMGYGDYYFILKIFIYIRVNFSYHSVRLISASHKPVSDYQYHNP